MRKKIFGKIWAIIAILIFAFICGIGMYNSIVGHEKSIPLFGASMIFFLFFNVSMMVVFIAFIDKD
jgi:hypothetical protein